MAAGREHLTSTTLPTRLREQLHPAHPSPDELAVRGAQHAGIARQAEVSPAQISALGADFGSAVFDDAEPAYRGFSRANRITRSRVRQGLADARSCSGKSSVG
jgi:hypothetical protein